MPGVSMGVGVGIGLSEPEKVYGPLGGVKLAVQRATPLETRS